MAEEVKAQEAEAHRQALASFEAELQAKVMREAEQEKSEMQQLQEELARLRTNIARQIEVSGEGDPEDDDSGDNVPQDGQDDGGEAESIPSGSGDESRDEKRRRKE